LLILSVGKAYSLSDGLRRSRRFDFCVRCFKHGVTATPAGGLASEKIDADVNEGKGGAAGAKFFQVWA
jgi:hypothetical protein